MEREKRKAFQQIAGVGLFVLCAYAAQDANPTYQLDYTNTQPSPAIIVERPQFDPGLNASEVFADWTKSHQLRRQAAELTAQR